MTSAGAKHLICTALTVWKFMEHHCCEKLTFVALPHSTIHFVIASKTQTQRTFHMDSFIHNIAVNKCCTMFMLCFVDAEDETGGNDAGLGDMGMGEGGISSGLGGEGT